MAHRGLILDNPLSGERFFFHETATDTDGERLVFELELPPGGRVPGGHVHPSQEERFDVLNGTMRFRKGMRRVTAESGDSVVVPAGTSHRFANVGDERRGSGWRSVLRSRWSVCSRRSPRSRARDGRSRTACRSRSSSHCSCAGSTTRCGRR